MDNSQNNEPIWVLEEYYPEPSILFSPDIYQIVVISPKSDEHTGQDVLEAFIEQSDISTEAHANYFVTEDLVVVMVEATPPIEA
jgi:hypothetical protein